VWRRRDPAWTCRTALTGRFDLVAVGVYLSGSSGWAGTLFAVARLSSKVLDPIGTLVRLGLAAIWLISGAIKAADINQTVAAVKAYQIMPGEAAALVGAILPFLELAFGVLVLLGVGTRLMAVLSGLMLLVYIGGVAQSWARGLTIDCGCFGGGGQVAAGQTQYPQEILRDTGFLLLAIWLVVRPRTLFSVDGWLASRQQEVDVDEDDAEDNGSDSGSAPSAVGRA
jgi:uncharacterized membrane protein YphA (DoxX/SURF4 family)